MNNTQPPTRPSSPSPSPLQSPLDQIDSWPVDNFAAAIVGTDGRVVRRGDTAKVFRLASISKILATWAILVAVEEGSVTLDSPIGQPGCTLRHLLSHAGGYSFTGDTPIAAAGTRRIYSNTGIELAANAVERATGIPFGTYLREAVLDPLAMAATDLDGSPAAGVNSSVDDLVTMVAEITTPTLLGMDTVTLATSVHFSGLDGVVPGLGIFRPCPWGLGVEIHGAKRPHWMGTSNSPETFGHFGGAGTMLWIDPVAGVSLIALTDRDFDEWSADALRLWPQLSDAVVAAAR
ncbi:MAG: serine hydrolase domain-containing protein [Ilumatobacteraceae bacterium]